MGDWEGVMDSNFDGKFLGLVGRWLKVVGGQGIAKKSWEGRRGQKYFLYRGERKGLLESKRGFLESWFGMWGVEGYL